MASSMSDKSFVHSFSIMIGGLVAVGIFLFVLANVVGGLLDDKFADELQASEDLEIARRIAPVGQIVIGAVETGVAQAVVADATAGSVSGEDTYKSSCSACHDAGVAGAPKVGDADSWAERVAQGMEVLHEHAVNGYQGSAGVMPAKGGNTSLSDEAVSAAVGYMVDQSR